MKTMYYLALAMLALPATAFLPSATADGAGASGQCYDESGTAGGADEVRVDTESGVEAGLEPTPGGGGITDALVMFAVGTVNDGGVTSTACDRYDCYGTAAECAANGQSSRFDYLAVDATVAGQFVQVCYRGSASLAGDCPQHPPGA